MPPKLKLKMGASDCALAPMLKVNAGGSLLSEGAGGCAGTGCFSPLWPKVKVMVFFSSEACAGSVGLEGLNANFGISGAGAVVLAAGLASAALKVNYGIFGAGAAASAAGLASGALKVNFGALCVLSCWGALPKVKLAVFYCGALLVSFCAAWPKVKVWVGCVGAEAGAANVLACAFSAGLFSYVMPKVNIDLFSAAGLAASVPNVKLFCF